VLLASMSLAVKSPSMSPAAQSGFGVATESPSQWTMAKRGSDDGCSGLTGDICPILHHGTGVGIVSGKRSASQWAASNSDRVVVK
jgi:hypothetical protein